MDIKQLRAFLAVANARSFLGAADTLYISRQAVSKTISQLEEELNIELFVRDQSGAMMTPAGIYFYPRAMALVADFDKLGQEMRDIDRAYRPTLNICMALGIHGLYADRLAEYGERHRTELEIRLRGCLDADCETLLTDRRADAALSFTPPGGKMAESSSVLESPVRLLVSRDDPLARQAGQEAVSRAPLLLYTGGRERCLWWPAEPRRQDVASSDLAFLLSLLRDGRGVLPLPQALMASCPEGAAALDDGGKAPVCRIYFSTLPSSYYNALIYNLLASVRKDVFSRPLGS